MTPLTRRKLLAAAAVAAGAAGTSRTAHARHVGLRITRHRVPWKGSRRIRIVQITDIHVGWATPRRVLARAARIAREIEPDAVVLTGDYVNHSLKALPRLTEFVASLPSPLIATLGNHDHWAGAREVAGALTAGGAEVLSNESSAIGGPGWALPVIGVDDGFTGHHDPARAFAGGGDPEASLVLSHFPNTADEIARHGARLILSGHTHGGQLAIPVVTEALSRLVGNRYFHGWYEIGPSALYVSAGIGHSLEGLRGGETAHPEIAVFELDPAAKQRESKTYRSEI